MTLTITIGGVVMTGESHFVAENSPAHTNALGQFDTWACRVISRDGTYRPAIGATVVVEDESGVRFGGTIRQLKVEQFGDALIADVGCSSWEQLFSRRFTGERERTYANVPAGEIVQDLLTVCMAGDGVEASIVAGGPNITVSFNCVPVRDALDQICALASNDVDTYIWDCTPAKVTRFYKQTSFPAPFNITDESGDVLQLGGSTRIGAEWSLDKYTNRVYPRMSQLIGEERSESFVGDGVQAQFDVALPLAAVPRVTIVSAVPDEVEITESITGDGYSREYWLSHKIATFDSANGVKVGGVSRLNMYATPNSSRLADSNDEPLPSGTGMEVTYTYYADTVSGVGVPQTVGEKGVDIGRQWYWTKGSTSIERDGALPALTSAETLQVDYQAYEQRILGPVENFGETFTRRAAEGGTGFYESIVDSESPGTIADAAARAQAWLDRYSQIPCTVEYPTLNSGCRAGQYQTIAFAALGVSATFLFESVTMSQVNGEYLWRVKAVSGALTGDYKMRLRELRAGGGAGSTGATGSGVVVSGGSGGGAVALYADGTLGIESDAAPAMYLPALATPSAVRAYVKSAPAGAALSITIYVGADAWLTLTFAAGETSVSASDSALSTAGAIQPDSNIRVGITSVGSSFPGADLSVFIYF